MIEAMAPPAPDEAALQPAIQIEGMHKRYGRTEAVRDLSMCVPAGSIYGFVGPNGAGKTTTIRTLATLQRADAGTITVAGIDLAADPAAVRDRVGYMPDFFGVYESLTVWEYLSFYGASYRIPAARRRQIAGELLELVELTNKREAPVEVLSRGMKQRLGLARCLIHDPEVLLLDEPASGMDPRARSELREILRELRRMGKTILVSSHILPELAEMCTHIGIIHAGRLLAEGPVDDVIRELSTGQRLRITLLDASHLPEGIQPRTGGAGAPPSAAAARPASNGSDGGSPDIHGEGGRGRPPLQGGHPLGGEGAPATPPPGHAANAVRILEETGGCENIEIEPDGSVLADYGGTEVDLAALLSQLVTAGVPVTGFTREGGTLEDIFLSLTDDSPEDDE